MSSSATYTHLRDGSWGVRIPGTAAPNQTVTVTKKDGETKQETVAKVLWTGRDSKSGQTISLCAIAGSGNHAGARGGRGHSRRDEGNCSCWQCLRGNECMCIYDRG